MAGASAVLEFGTSKIVCIIDKTSTESVAEYPGAAYMRYGGIKNSKWGSFCEVPKLLEQVVEEAEDKIKKQIGSIIVGLPPCFTHIERVEGRVQTEKGKISKRDIANLIKQIAPHGDQNWVLADVRPAYFVDDTGTVYIDPPYEQPSRFVHACFTFAYGYKPFMDDVFEMISALHISVERFVPETVAAAAHIIPQDVRDNTAILMDIGYFDTSLSAVFADCVLESNVLHMGGANVIAALRKTLGVDVTLAESLKRGHYFGIDIDDTSRVYGKNSKGRMEFFDARTVKRAIETVVDDIADSCKDKLREYRGLISPNAPVYVTGSGIAAAGLDNFLRNKLGREVFIHTELPETTISQVYYNAMCLLDKKASQVYDLNSFILFDEDR